MKYYYVIFLFQFVLSQSTFLHMDQLGVQSLAELLIQNLKDKEFQLDVNYTQNLFIGHFQLQGFNISEISSDPSQINIEFNEKLNSIDVDLKIDRMLLQTDIQLNLIGLTMIKERSKIEVTNSHLSLSLVLGSENQAIRVHVNKHKFNKFNIGKIHLLNGKNWYQKLIHSVASTSINMIIFVVKGTIQKKLVNTIDQYGSQIPKSFSLPHPLEIAVMDLPLASNPQVIENEIKIDFLCGSDYVHHDIEQPGYIHLTMSESCINSVLQQAYKVQGVFDVSAIAQELSDVMEIDSKTLGQLFPGFWDLDHPQDVSFQINLNSEEEPLIQMEDGYALVKLPLKVDINLVEIRRERPMIHGIKVLKVNDSHGEYYTSINTTALVNFDILKEYSGLVGNLNGIELKNLKVSDPLKMNMEAWNYQQNVALQFGRSYANQVIYGQMIKPQNYIETLSIHQIELAVEKGEIDFRIQF